MNVSQEIREALKTLGVQASNKDVADHLMKKFPKSPEIRRAIVKDFWPVTVSQQRRRYKTGTVEPTKSTVAAKMPVAVADPSKTETPIVTLATTLSLKQIAELSETFTFISGDTGLRCVAKAGIDSDDLRMKFRQWLDLSRAFGDEMAHKIAVILG